MKIQPYNPNVPTWIKYLLLIITGTLIILLSTFIQQVPVSIKDDYYYSTLLRSNFTLPVKIIFFIVGLAAGYFYKLNPWLTGICLVLFFPLTAIIEAIVYPGSHNLIPFEFAYHFWLALPVVAAVYIGRFIFIQVKKRKQ